MPRNQIAWHGYFEAIFMNRKQFITNISAGLLGTGLLQNVVFAQKNTQNTSVKITNVKPNIFNNVLYVKVDEAVMEKLKLNK